MNLSILISLICPPVLYSLIIYITSPYKSISIKKSAYYFAGGMLSTTILSIINLAVPYSKIEYLTEPFLFYFKGVALHEELAKFVAFMIMYKILRQKGDHPIGTMFYLGMVGLGFAMVENMGYLRQYGEQVLLIRNVSSTLAHMIFGMFTGYWISLGKTRRGKYGNRSLFDIVLLKNDTLRFYTYSLIGITSGIAYHGLWNYSLVVSGNASTPIMILMLLIGLIGCKFASDNLIVVSGRK
tara:strand:- start:3053 stop:3772 length:720 start_codon:yes stop_codon:yes gene_type:complete